jgi:serine/threonine protein kinase
MTAGIGTLVYTAPEVWPSATAADVQVSKLEYNKPVDIYALALILHELFGGGRSFYPAPKGCHPNQQQIMLITAKSKRDPPRLNLEQLPSALRDVVSQGVDSDPTKRPSLEDFDAAINRVN